MISSSAATVAIMAAIQCLAQFYCDAYTLVIDVSDRTFQNMVTISGPKQLLYLKAMLKFWPI